MLPPWIVGLGLITYRSARSGNSATNPVPHFSLPADYAGAFFVFGLLSLAQGQAERPAQIAAWGLNVAILLNLWTPGVTTKPTTTQAPAQTTSGKVTTK